MVNGDLGVAVKEVTPSPWAASCLQPVRSPWWNISSASLDPSTMSGPGSAVLVAGETEAKGDRKGPGECCVPGPMEVPAGQRYTQDSAAASSGCWEMGPSPKIEWPQCRTDQLPRGLDKGMMCVLVRGTEEAAGCWG